MNHGRCRKLACSYVIYILLDNYGKAKKALKLIESGETVPESMTTDNECSGKGKRKKKANRKYAKSDSEKESSSCDEDLFPTNKKLAFEDKSSKTDSRSLIPIPSLISVSTSECMRSENTVDQMRPSTSKETSNLLKSGSTHTYDGIEVFLVISNHAHSESKSSGGDYTSVTLAIKSKPPSCGNSLKLNADN